MSEQSLWNSQGIDVALLHQAVEHHAEIRPNQIAVDEKERAISYADLSLLMRKLASMLIALGIKPNDRVGFLIDNGIDASVALLGAMRADGCYVPMTPNYPAERIATVIADSEMKALITISENLELFQDAITAISSRGEHLPNALIVLDKSILELENNFPVYQKIKPLFSHIFGRDEHQKASHNPPPNCATEEDLAYIIFTSGTTGSPKGVMLRHRNVKAFIYWLVDRFKFSPADRIGNHARFSFDLSILDIFGSFFSGATLCPVLSDEDRRIPGSFMIDQKISIWISVPSAIRALVKLNYVAKIGEAGYLRCGLFCGEALPAEFASVWLDSLPDAEIHNLYGPTEAAVACTSFNVGVDAPLDMTRSIPIGRESRDTRIILLALDCDELANVDKVGRLMILGSQVCAGYWKKPELTRELFRHNPLDMGTNQIMYDTGDLARRDKAGIIYFEGRADSQVKINGHRIELGEIEITLSRHPSVMEAIVVTSGQESPMLIGIVSSKETTNEQQNAEILEHCRTLLPSYMVPRKILFVEDFPRNANGKIDRKASSAMID